MDQHSSAASLPRGFRYADRLPKTPEPFAETEEAQIPSPPRPRLKLKRRNASQLSAPTQQFLASVAAADVPIPSIEEPEITSVDLDMNETLPSMDLLGHEQHMSLSLKIRGRAFSPPKTPAPVVVPSLSPPRYPNWTIDSTISSIESTPDCESSRPSTSRSNRTSDSLFSRLSSDYEQCGSPEAEENDKLVYASIDDIGSNVPAGRGDDRRRKAPWTRAMNAHLWATYVLYLQDPKVTPFRMGKSCIPPHGVCLRVAREAKRSWKGSKSSNTDGARKSGSSTPTAESCGAFIQWPHTGASTRAHLRELCRLKASSLGMRNLHCLSRSPTPFTQAAARHWNRRSTPGRSTTFATDDMTKSLALSTSETMQPEAPLAQLTSSVSDLAEPRATPSSNTPAHVLRTFDGEPSFAERRRLGSPFSARSYGPSSSASLAAALGLGTPMSHRQTHTIGPRRTLQSPVRLSRSGTQKRKTTQSNEPRKRPSLGSDTWMDPTMVSSSGVAVTQDTQFSSTTSSQHDELFIPRIPADPCLASSASMPDVGKHLAPPALAPPPRLGSPFSGGSSSFSFPNRLRNPIGVNIAALQRPFATVQQTQESAAGPARPNLASRLAYIDKRLKEFNRDSRRRSESPL